MDEQARAYVTQYINGTRKATCLEILAGPNPAVMASMVTLKLSREDHKITMSESTPRAEEFVRILESIVTELKP